MWQQLEKKKHTNKLLMSGRTPLETPQHLVDKSVVGSDDDKWLIYEVEEKSQPHHDVKLILLRNVDDYGVKGQVGFYLPYVYQNLDLKRKL